MNMCNSTASSARPAKAELTRRLVAAAVCCCLCGIVRADEVNLINQRFQVALGIFLNSTKLNIKVNGQTVGETGSDVDWDNTFGNQEENRFRIDGVWRINPRHHLRMMYTDYSRSRTRDINTQIEWQDQVFPINTSVTGKLGFEILEAAYEYAFMRSDSYEVAGSVGLHYASFEAELSASVDDQQGQGPREIGGKASVGAPLPVIGMHGMWRFGRSWYLDGQLQAFALSFDEYDGAIWNARAVVLWQPKALFGIGLGYDYFRVDLDVDRPRFNGSMDWIYSGPQLFVSMSF